MPFSSRRLGAERRTRGSQHRERRTGRAGVAGLDSAPTSEVWEVRAGRKKAKGKKKQAAEALR